MGRRTVLRAMGVVVAAVLALLFLGLATGGGDDDGAQPPGTTAAPLEVVLRPPGDLDLELLAGSCESATCRVEATFMDRSQNESGYRSRFVYGLADTSSERLAPVDGSGDTVRLVEVMPFDDPACWTVRVDGNGESDSSEPFCRMLAATATGNRLVDGVGLVQALDLADGQCGALAEGQEVASADAWYRLTPCAGAFAVKSFFRESPTAITSADAASRRCGEKANSEADQSLSRYVAYTGQGRDGRPTMTCVWVG